MQRTWTTSKVLVAVDFSRALKWPVRARLLCSLRPLRWSGRRGEVGTSGAFTDSPFPLPKSTGKPFVIRFI